MPDSDISDDETLPLLAPAGSISRGCRKLLPGLCAPYSTNMSVPSGLALKIAKRLRGPTCSQRENMMSPLARTTGLRSWLWLTEICLMSPPWAFIVCSCRTRSRSYSSSAKAAWPLTIVFVRLWRFEENTKPRPAGR